MTDYTVMTSSEIRTPELPNSVHLLKRSPCSWDMRL